MHRFRSQARHAAWRTEEGSSNLNPFARTTSRKSTDAEGGSHLTNRVRSNGSAPTRTPMSPDGIARGEPSVPEGNEESTLEDGTREKKRERVQEPAAASNKPVRGKYSPMRAIDNIRRKTAKYPKIPAVQQLKNVLFSWINILLILVPVGFAVEYAHVDPIIVFVINFIAIVPLAGMLSFATEELALYCGENVGGLLNATFGNAVELIVSIIALLQKPPKIVIVQTSLIGSMLSNLLLVLGMAFVAGGWSRIEQEFNSAVAQISCSLLAVAVSSLILPTAYHEFTGEGGGSGSRTEEETRKFANKINPGVDKLSRATALLLLLVYASYLLFQLRTHKSLFNEKSPKSAKRNPKDESNRSIRRSLVDVGATGFPAATGGSINQDHITDVSDDEEDDADEEMPQVSVLGALLTLGVSTVLVAFCSEFMVSGIDSVTKGPNGISEVFVGLILIPIVGNAAEHATAVTVAIKDKIPLSISVAVGSSLQIALFVVPVMVCLGWILGIEGMNLWFDGFQTTALFIAVLLVNYLIADGKTNYLEGLILIVLYIIIAVAAFFTPNPETEA